MLPRSRIDERAERPNCTVCGGSMWLTRVSPIEVVHEMRSFECRSCGHTDRYAVRAGPESYWVLIGDSAVTTPAN